MLNCIHLNIPFCAVMKVLLECKITSEPPSPLELVCHLVVWQIPSRVLHEGEGDPGIKWVLGVRACHGLILERDIRLLGLKHLQ